MGISCEIKIIAEPSKNRIANWTAYQRQSITLLFKGGGERARQRRPLNEGRQSQLSP
jgi:hypothetical protein